MLLFAKLATQIGSMIIIGFEGTQPSDPSVKTILKHAKAKKIGGIILFRRNIENKNQVKRLIDTFKRVNPKLFVCVDQEGGFVSKIEPPIAKMEYPSAQEVSLMPHQRVAEIYNNMSEDLSECGFNVNFAPCVDVLPSKLSLSPVIGDYQRSYGSDAFSVVKNAQIFIEQHKKNGIMCCIKHFPGHGSATFDSHKEVFDVSSYYDERTELAPFMALSTKALMVMVAHLINTNWDDKPATLSKNTIDKLRTFFDGVIVSDDLHMGGILKSYSIKKAVLMSIKAGNNMIIISNMPQAAINIKDFETDHDLPNKIIDWVSKEIPKDKILRSQIRKSYRKILKLKKCLPEVNPTKSPTE